MCDGVLPRGRSPIVRRQGNGSCRTTEGDSSSETRAKVSALYLVVTCLYYRQKGEFGRIFHYYEKGLDRMRFIKKECFKWVVRTGNISDGEFLM